MKIWLLSFGEIDYDGRLKELLKIAQKFEDHVIVCISCKKSECSNEKYMLVKGNLLSIKHYTRFILHSLLHVRPKRGDIILSDNYFAALPTLILKLIYRNIKVIQDVREMYLMNDTNSLKGKLLLLMERKLMRIADVVICANKYRANMMYEMFKLRKMPIVFENIRFLDGISESNDPNIYKKNLAKQTVCVVSTGGISAARGSIDLIKSFIELPDNYKLILIGGGSKEEKITIEELIKQHCLKNIELKGKVPMLDLKSTISSCDVGVVIYPRNNINNEYCASGKIYEYIGEGLPVITSLNPPLAELCKETGIGIASDNYSDAIKSIVSNYEAYQKNVSAYKESISINENIINCYNSIIDAIGSKDKYFRKGSAC